MTNTNTTPTTCPLCPHKQYEVRCDVCKSLIGETDLFSESAAGGRCDNCHITSCKHENTREEKSGYGHTSTVTVCNDCGSDVLGTTCAGCDCPPEPGSLFCAMCNEEASVLADDFIKNELGN